MRLTRRCCVRDGTAPEPTWHWQRPATSLVRYQRRCRSPSWSPPVPGGYWLVRQIWDCRRLNSQPCKPLIAHINDIIDSSSYMENIPIYRHILRATRWWWWWWWWWLTDCGWLQVKLYGNTPNEWYVISCHCSRCKALLVTIRLVQQQQQVRRYFTHVFFIFSSPPNLHLALSEQWCWSGGKGILTELSLCYSIV